MVGGMLSVTFIHRLLLCIHDLFFTNTFFWSKKSDKALYPPKYVHKPGGMSFSKVCLFSCPNSIDSVFHMCDEAVKSLNHVG